ncbi:MAG: hypothetical protein WAX77_14065 [Methylococcaceae bacterium]
MITIPAKLEQPFLKIAECEHKSVAELIEIALIEFLEDYHDARLAELAIERIQRGEDELLSIEQAEKLVYEMDCKNQ